MSPQYRSFRIYTASRRKCEKWSFLFNMFPFSSLCRSPPSCRQRVQVDVIIITTISYTLFRFAISFNTIFRYEKLPSFYSYKRNVHKMLSWYRITQELEWCSRKMLNVGRRLWRLNSPMSQPNHVMNFYSSKNASVSEQLTWFFASERNAILTGLWVNGFHVRGIFRAVVQHI